MRKGDAPHGASPWSYCNGKVLLNQNFIFASKKISKVKVNGLGNFVFTDTKLKGYKNYYKPEETEE